MKNYFMMFSLLSVSPWPLLMSFYFMYLMISFLKFFMNQGLEIFLFWLIMFMLILFQWWRDVIREGFYLGNNSFKMMNSMKLGMLLFILSEVMFFISFFWSYFSGYLSPVIEIGMYWCPKNIFSFNPYGVPLMNTMILLCSGVLLTLSHMLLIMGVKNLCKNYFLLTILLGVLFTIMQLNEYMESMFMINDSFYGSIFYILTGFHGLHVIVGTIFLMIMYYRMMKGEMSKNFHLGFDFSAWYWHFVDVVWLFLYFLLYFMMMV